MIIPQLTGGEWFNGKTAAFKVADLGSNPCSPAKYITEIAEVPVE